MNTLDNLREIFEQDAGRAPAPHGVAEAAAAGAGRIRRRRRVLAVAGAAILVVAAAVVVPIASRHDATGPLPAAPALTRKPGQLTALWPPGTNPTTRFLRSDGTLQWMNLGTVCCNNAFVYDPGTYDATELIKGEPVTVAGHAAHYALVKPSLPGATGPVATVGWQDPSGAWVIVIHTSGHRRPDVSQADAGKSEVLKMAATVRTGPPLDVAVPFHLPAVPRDLGVTFVEASPRDGVYSEDGRSDLPIARAMVGLGGGNRPLLADDLYPPDVSRPLMITSWAKQLVTLFNYPEGKPTGTVDGNRVWYIESPRFQPPPSSALVVQAGNCYVEFLVQDRKKITKADLIAMLAGATFDDCGQPATWTGPMTP